MKTIDVFFKDSNFIGRELENVQDLVKAQAAGMNIANVDGCGYCTFGEKEVEDEDGDTHFEEYEKTEQELFEEIKNDIENGSPVYAGFFLDMNEHEIVPASTTTLQSKFYVDQEVFFMKDNKIQRKYIFRILLNKTADYSSSSDYTEVVGEGGGKIVMQHEKSSIYTLADKRYYNSINAHNCVAYEHMEVKKEGEFFATKEELVKHLLEN